MVHAKGRTLIRFIESDGERLPFYGYPYTFISDADPFFLLSPNHKRKTEQTITVMRFFFLEWNVFFAVDLTHRMYG